MKKKINRFILFIIFIFVIFTLTGCSNKKESDLKEKINSEIAYLDNILLTMLNDLNSIQYRNYVVVAQQVSKNNSEKQSSNNESSESSSSSNGGETESTNTSNNESSTNNVNYKLNLDNMISKDRTPDWDTLKSNIEKLYDSWGSIVLDLYKLNISNEDILNFSNDLQLAVKNVKEENKTGCLQNLAKLYSYIPKYISSYSDDSVKTNLYKTKSHILNAYSMAEQGDRTALQKELASAEQAYMPIINNINSNNLNQQNVNKIYVLLKELESNISTKDIDVFYINYKNLIQEILILQG